MPRWSPRRSLTETQLATLQAIADHWATHGCAPTLRLLLAKFELSSHQAIDDRVGQLKRLGLITWEPLLSRTLQLTAAGKAALRDNGRLFAFLPVEKCERCGRVHVLPADKSVTCQSSEAR